MKVRMREREGVRGGREGEMWCERINKSEWEREEVMSL